MLHSLRQQIGLLLGILVAVIIIQVFLTRISQQELVNNQKTVDQAFLLAEQVYALERDIIDLQRNLLIFKETASDTSIERFGELIIDVTQKVERINLEGLNVADQSISSAARIQRAAPGCGRAARAPAARLVAWPPTAT